MCLGAVANRHKHVPAIDKAIAKTLAEYNHLEVKEHLGLSYTEYLDTDHLLRQQYVIFLEEILEKRNEENDKNT